MPGHKKNKGQGGGASRPSTPLSEPRPSIVAQTIAAGLDATAPPIRFMPRSSFPGLGAGPRMNKGPKVTAFDPPPVVVSSIPVAPEQPPPPSSRRPAFEHEPPTAPDRPTVPPPETPRAVPKPPRRDPEPTGTGAPPFPAVASLPPFAAAHANAYSEDYQARERERWGKNRHVPQPDIKLVHCWTLALVHFPPAALTIWLTRTTPAQNSYEFWISGEELIDPMFPDRKLYDVMRRKRRQPSIAESFTGRIRGVSENGTQYDCGYGEIHLPPEEPQTAAPAWGSAAMSPWGPAPPGYGPPPWSGPPGYGPPPWGGWGPPPQWGGPPPPWAQPWAGAAPPPPPATVASDPLLLQVWQASAEATANAQRLSAESASRAADHQTEFMKLLLTRALMPPAAAAPAGGGIRETMSMLKDVATFVETVRGPREETSSGRGLTIHNLGNGERLVETKDGEIDIGATVGLGIKSGITEIAQAVSKYRSASGRGPGMTQVPAAAAPVGGALSGARMNKAPPPAPAVQDRTAPNGAATQ